MCARCHTVASTISNDSPASTRWLGPSCGSLPSQVSVAEKLSAPVKRKFSPPSFCPSSPASVSAAAPPTLLIEVKERSIAPSASAGIAGRRRRPRALPGRRPGPHPRHAGCGEPGLEARQGGQRDSPDGLLEERFGRRQRGGTELGHLPYSRKHKSGCRAANRNAPVRRHNRSHPQADRPTGPRMPCAHDYAAVSAGLLAWKQTIGSSVAVSSIRAPSVCSRTARSLLQARGCAAA